MTRRTRRNHSPAFKAKVAVSAIKGEKTLADLAQLYDVHRTRSPPGRPTCLREPLDCLAGPPSPRRRPLRPWT